MSYDFSARGYLERAKACLQRNDPSNLFYAAFELRCGVESRMQEYLHAWDHIPEKQKTEWKIGHLGRSTEKHFILRDKYQEWAVLNMETDKVEAILYYTPVTGALRRNAEILGNYLHSPNITGDRTVWWTEFRLLLDQMAAQLQNAVTGTLLGPVMFVKGSKKMSMQSELLGGLTRERIGQLGELVTVKIDYLDALPAVMPAEAIVWRSKN